MDTGVLRTMWVLDAFRCVLRREQDRYALYVLIRNEPFLMESARTLEEAEQKADTLYAVFCPRDQESAYA